MQQPPSIIKPHIQRLAGSGRLLESLIIERSLESAFTEYELRYQPPSQHIIVAPTSHGSSLEWHQEDSKRPAKAIFTPDDLILNPSGCFTRPRWDRDTRFTLVAVEPTGVARVCEELEIPEISVPQRFHFQNGKLTRTIERLIACFESEPCPLLEAQALERTLVRQLVGECRAQREGLHQLSRARISVVKELVQERLAQPITLEEMAIAAGYSPSRFLLLFRNATGFSPHQYVMRERLGKARLLLSATRLHLSQIALDCGFADQSHFIRLFKRHTGLTPSQFRQ